ncbi:MAG TPA: transcription antitermination factor NusB [Kofleriaceae bacterium]|nr:transcription antitermination factor NusB [Kofleriaceae bacterium]
MAAGIRRRGRAYGLQVLYALDINEGGGPTHAVAEYWQMFQLELDAPSLEFAGRLVATTRERLAEIDDAIQSASRNWRLDRMSRVDRNILRLATCELRHSPDVPVKVVINEAVELAKRFGTADSPAFVNGILDRIAHQLRRPGVDDEEPGDAGAGEVAAGEAGAGEAGEEP